MRSDWRRGARPRRGYRRRVEQNGRRLGLGDEVQPVRIDEQQPFSVGLHRELGHAGANDPGVSEVRSAHDQLTVFDGAQAVRKLAHRRYVGGDEVGSVVPGVDRVEIPLRERNERGRGRAVGRAYRKDLAVREGPEPELAVEVEDGQIPRHGKGSVNVNESEASTSTWVWTKGNGW